MTYDGVRQELSWGGRVIKRIQCECLRSNENIHLMRCGGDKWM